MSRLKRAFMQANWFTLLIIGVLVILPFAQLPFVLGGGSGSSGPEFYQEGDDIISLRTENSKTYSLGKGEYRIEISSGIIHYKDNYANSTEPWKDINLKWDGEFLDTAPYILKSSKNEKKLFFTDKITNTTGTIQLQSVNPPQLDYEIVPFNEGVSFQFEVSAGTNFRVKYKVTGNVTLITRAYDDEGEIELEVTYNEKSGELTESLDVRGKVKDKATGNARDIKGKVKIDPTWTIQPAEATSEDNYMDSNNPTLNYGTSQYLYTGLSGSSQYRSLVEFSTTWSSLPAGSSLTAATFSLYCSVYGLPKYIYVHRLLRLDWVEASSSWKNYKVIVIPSEWSGYGASGVGSDIYGSDIAQILLLSTGWKDWNVLAQVNTAKTGNTNVAMRVADNVDGIAASTFYSSNYGTASLRPKLVITYICPPTMTTSASSNIMPTYFTANGEITHTGDAAVTTRGFCYKEAEGATSSWVSPTGHNDLDAWANEVNAYNGNTGTAAATVTVDGELELTIASTICNKVQIHAYEFHGGSTYDPEVTISVYYGGAYHEIWSGSIMKSTWVEKSIGSTQYVTKAKISFNSITGNGYLDEFQFDTPNPPTTSDDKVYETGSWAAYPTAYSLVIGEETYGEDELVPETSYLVRAYGSNTQGTGYGSTIITTTIAPVAPEVDTDACSDIHATSMEGNGEITYWGGDNATRRGFAYTEDLKYALDFNGASDYLSVGTMGSFGSTCLDEGTVEMWITTTESRTTRYVFGTTNDGASVFFCLVLNYPSSGQTTLVVRATDAKRLSGYTTADIYDGEEHHFASTYKCSTNTLQFFVDGISQSATYEYQQTPASFANFQYAMVFGADNNRGSLTGYSAVKLDDIRFWGDIRTQTEVQDDMYSELVGNEAGLVGYWKLNEGTGTTAEDSTSNNNDGTITGADWEYQSWDVQVEYQAVPYAGNPIYSGHSGIVPAWPVIQCYNSTWYLYYTEGGETSVYYATSPDEINFTYQGIALSVGGPGEWDDDWIEVHTILWDDTTGQWLMYYGGTQVAGSDTHVGIATADNLAGPWVKYDGNPVLSPGGENQCADPNVIRESASSWRMYYCSDPLNSFTYWRISLATSMDGFSWTKYDSGNPIDTLYGWREHGGGVTGVIEKDDGYWILTQGRDASYNLRLGILYSTDGTTLIEPYNIPNPILGTQAEHADLEEVGGHLYFYYYASNNLWLAEIVPISVVESGNVEYECGSFYEGAYSLTIDDLTPETWYRVRAFAGNIGGIGCGDVVAAQTLVAGHPYSWGYILGA